MRGRISVVLAVVILAGCASAPPAQGPPGQSAPIPTVDPEASADPALVARFMAEGLTDGQAIFAALTRVEVEQLTPVSYRIIHAYPTGNSAEFTVTLTPDQTADPEAPVSATYTDSDGDFGLRLEYFIAYDDMPEDVEAEIRGASAGGHAPIRFAGTGLDTVALTAAEKSGVRVVVEGLVKEFRDAAVSLFVEALDAALGPKAVADKLYNGLKAALSIKDAFAMGAEHDRLMARIDELEECAKNPTNPVTKRAYQTDPAQKQKILDTVAEARLEVKSNIAVIFLGMINSTGSGLAGSKVLGFIIGPATAYVEQELKKLNEGWIKVLENLITPCEGFTFAFSGRNLTIPDLGTFDLVGKTFGCPEDGGGWRFTGTYTITNHAYKNIFEEESHDGWLLDMRGSQDPEFTVELVLGWEATVEKQMPYPEGEGFVRVSDALGRLPSAVASVYSSLGDHLGDYPLEVTPVTPECGP